MSRVIVAVLAVGASIMSGCAPLVEVPEGFPEMPVPADNPLTAEKIELGRALFFDERLSRDQSISCASCHLQDNAFADPRPVSFGVDGKFGNRNAPPLFNLAWNTSFFWDGGVDTMEKQVIGPITNPLEMNMTMKEVVARLNDDAEMVDAFKAAFGAGPSAERVTKAIASFERTIVSGDSRFDRGELTHEEERGKELFFSETAECFHCHGGFDFTNHQVMNNGMNTNDPGRARITEDARDDGKFKVPSLRNVAFTAPYMHDGSLETLEDVVEHYRKGGQGHPNTDPTIHPLALSDADARALVAFLRSLSDTQLLTDERFMQPRP